MPTYTFSGTSNAGTRTIICALPTAAQSMIFSISTSQTLGGDALGAVGTDLSIDALSVQTTGSYSGQVSIANLYFRTYPDVETGGSGLAPLSQSVFQTSVAPNPGITPIMIDVGTPPPGTVVGFSATGTISTQGTVSGGAYDYGYISTTGGTNTCTWESQTSGGVWPPGTTLNGIYGLAFNNDEGINISYTATLTTYSGEALILDPVTPTAGMPISLAGLNLGSLASTLSVSQDSAAFGTTTMFDAGVNWTSLGAVGLYGTHTVQVKDAVTGVLSNIVTYTLNAPVNTSYQGLFQSDVIPSNTDVYTEFSNSMSWTFKTVLLPDNAQLAENGVMRTTLAMEFIGISPTVSAVFLDSQGNTLSATTVTPAGLTSEWDGTPALSTWDVTPWDGSTTYLSPWWMEWPGPVVFKQAFFQATGISSVGFRIGNINADYRVLGYTQQTPSGVT